MKTSEIDDDGTTSDGDHDETTAASNSTDHDDTATSSCDPTESSQGPNRIRKPISASTPALPPPPPLYHLPTTPLNTLAERLEALVALSTNRSCADCPVTQATWASLLVPPPGTTDRARLGQAQKSLSRWSSGSSRRNLFSGDGMVMPYKLGVLVCVQCYLHHAQLGKQICRVKNTQKVDDCTCRLCFTHNCFCVCLDLCTIF